MVVAVNRIFVKKEYRKAFEDRFRARLKIVEQQPGCTRTEFLCATEGEDYLIMIWWESAEAFQQWVQSEAFQKAHAQPVPQEWFSKPNEFQLYTVLK